MILIVVKMKGKGMMDFLYFRIKATIVWPNFKLKQDKIGKNVKEIGMVHLRKRLRTQNFHF